MLLLLLYSLDDSIGNAQSRSPSKSGILREKVVRGKLFILKGRGAEKVWKRVGRKKGKEMGQGIWTGWAMATWLAACAWWQQVEQDQKIKPTFLITSKELQLFLWPRGPGWGSLYPKWEYSERWYAVILVPVPADQWPQFYVCLFVF